MTKPNLTKALAELNMCKQYKIKPNFSELFRKTGIVAQTLMCFRKLSCWLLVIPGVETRPPFSYLSTALKFEFQ